MPDPKYPVLSATGQPTSFAEATAVRQIDSHTYSAFFQDDWSVGNVPHGGLVTSAFLQATSKHFATTLRAQGQPHTIIAHLDFFRRTQTGPAKLVVKDLKLGRQTSVIHITLIQNDQEEVTGTLTNSNINAESGLSLDTEYSLHPPPVPVDLSKLRGDTDPNWELLDTIARPGFRKVFTKATTWLPRQGQHHHSLADEWIAFSNGERFTNESLGFVCDIWPLPIEAYRPQNAHRTKGGKPSKTPLDSNGTPYWYPTLALNLDIKKTLPAEGVEFLFVRVRTKKVLNGRFDLEVVITDEEGDVVALSHQVSLILGMQRNIAGRAERGKL
ncbi:MAG: hypothetical protein M1840_001449 [Geoglossum simile]|nr:MAG: hypothetical protein M1840_001449 [Geoglossum simile]